MSISMLDAEKRTLKVIKTFEEINPGSVSLHSQFINDLGVDEFDMVDIVMQVESEFGIEISDLDAHGFTTGYQIVSYVSKRSDAR